MYVKQFSLRVLNKLKLLKFFNLTYTIALKQKKIVVPICGGVGFNNLTVSEEWMIEVLTLLKLNKDEVFIDVGVNVGQTLMKFKTVYMEMNYVGFEPNVSCVNYTNLLIEKNRWNNISLIPSGISEEVGLGILEYYADDMTDSSASIVANYRVKSQVYKRDIVSLLNVSSVEHIWKGKKISTIKIDVEGAELGVLTSFYNSIKKDRPYLLVEILPVYDNQNKERLEKQIAIEKILNELDYTIYRIYKSNTNGLEAIKAIESIGIHSHLDACDYIFSPQVLTLT